MRAPESRNKLYVGFYIEFWNQVAVVNSQVRAKPVDVNPYKCRGKLEFGDPEDQQRLEGIPAFENRKATCYRR